MQTVKRLFDFYIQSSLHVALAVYALIRITFIKLNIPYDENVAYFGFYGTIVGYNFIKYDELARIKKVALNSTFKMIIALSFFSAIAAFYYFLELKTETKLYGLVTLVCTILYTLPFFPHRNNMRNWSGIKIYIVALVWVGVTVILPVVNATIDFSIIVILKCIQRFIFVFVLMLIFEIIDLQVDEKTLETIPQKIGKKCTKYLNFILISAFFCLDFLKPNIFYKQWLVTLSISVILMLFTYFANTKRTKYYTSFWVESVPFFWLILIMLHLL